MKRMLIAITTLFLSFQSQASRLLQGPPFPWHDWMSIAFQGPNSFHQKAIDIYIQNVSSVQQTVTVVCEFKNLSHTIGQWGGTYTPLQVASMESGSTVSTNKFQRSNVTIAPNDVIRMACQVDYSSQENMGTNYRDNHQVGTLLTSIEIAEDRGAVVAYLNSRTENYGGGGAAGPKFENNGAINEAMLRNISKTFFYNGGRAF